MKSNLAKDNDLHNKVVDVIGKACDAGAGCAMAARSVLRIIDRYINAQRKAKDDSASNNSRGDEIALDLENLCTDIKAAGLPYGDSWCRRLNKRIAQLRAMR